MKDSFMLKTEVLIVTLNIMSISKIKKKRLNEFLNYTMYM
jgi:hypothetical protein